MSKHAGILKDIQGQLIKTEAEIHRLERLFEETQDDKILADIRTQIDTYN